MKDRQTQSFIFSEKNLLRMKTNNEDKIKTNIFILKTFSDEGKLRELVTRRTVLEDLLMEVLQAKKRITGKLRCSKLNEEHWK